MRAGKFQKNNLKKLAETQYGYFTTSQISDAGYKRAGISYHVKKGDWIKIDRALYRLNGFEDSYESNCFKWVLWSRDKNEQPQGVISHESALVIYKLFDYKEDMPVHLTVPKEFRKRNMPEEGLVIYKKNLSLSELENHGCFLTTKLFYTLLSTKQELELQERWSEVAEKVSKSGKLTENELQKLGIFSTGSKVLNTGNIDFSGGEISPKSMINEKNKIYYRANNAKEIFESLEKQGRWRMAANSHNKNKHYQSGFTLVELLVVIAIISVLAGMLLPALSMSLEAARGIVCKNNLKSLNFSLTTYADDYDGWTLGTYYHYFGKSVKWPWLRVLCEEGYISEPYKGGTPEGGSVFYCPSQSDGEITPGLPATHYGINRTLCTVGRDMKSRGIKSWTSVTLGLVKIYSINPPSEIMSFADSQMDSYGVSYYTPASYPNFRHHEIMTNFSFIDGHVESAEQSDVFLNADRWVIPGYPWYFSSY